MPYFITDKSPNCSGWATIKEDGEVMGCHDTKQQAIDQMVAISVAEDMQPGGERIDSGPQAVIVDIDGTLIVSGGRNEKLYNFLDEMSDTRIFIVTGRNVSDREQTVNQLDDLGIDYDRLFMNPGSTAQTAEFKKSTAENLLKEYNVILAIDNNETMRKVYRDLGITALDVTDVPDSQRSEMRAAPSELNVGDYVSWDSAGGRARGEIKRIERDGRINVPDSDFVIFGTNDDPAALIAIYEKVGDGWQETDVLVAHKFSTLTKIDPLPEPTEDVDEEMNTIEQRQVDLTPPAYMRAAARRGLELNRQGFGGEGLTDKTKQEARDMADGRVSEDKWRRIAPWIARHLVDLDAPKNNNPDDSGYPGAGLVAHLLWGSGPSKRSAVRTMEYAQRIIDQLDAEENKTRWSSINVKSSKTEKDNAVTKVERRVKTDVNFELRIDNAEADGMRFTGYAAVFNSDSEPLPFIERIVPGAFKRSLKSRNEVKLFKNHNMDEVLASTRSKTLRLTEDSKGLLAEAVLPDTTAGRDLAVLMKRGDVHAMSFGFSVPAKGDKWSEDGMTRELHQIRLHEVSIVTGFPAYEATTASVRSLDVLASRTNVNPDALADALLKLENGETLPADQADLLSEVVAKLKDNQPNVDDLLAVKRKQLDLLFKAM